MKLSPYFFCGKKTNGHWARMGKQKSVTHLIMRIAHCSKLIMSECNMYLSEVFYITVHSSFYIFCSRFYEFLYMSLYSKWRFPLRLFQFGPIHWRNPGWKTSFFVQCVFGIFACSLSVDSSWYKVKVAFFLRS